MDYSIDVCYLEMEEGGKDIWFEPALSLAFLQVQKLDLYFPRWLLAIY
jgi:hypothetical protein